MEELVRSLGGFQGIVAIVAAVMAIAWRVRIPQIGIDYLTRELEVNRKEREVADKDRASLRVELQGLRLRMVELDREYLSCLADREKCRRHIRALERQVKEGGGEAVAGDEERHS